MAAPAVSAFASWCESRNETRMRPEVAPTWDALEAPGGSPNATASASRTMAAAGRPVFAERSTSARCRPQRSTVRSSLRAGDDKAETFIAKLVLQRRHRAYPAITNAFSIGSDRGLETAEFEPKISALQPCRSELLTRKRTQSRRGVRHSRPLGDDHPTRVTGCRRNAVPCRP